MTHFRTLHISVNIFYLKPWLLTGNRSPTRQEHVKKSNPDYIQAFSYGPRQTAIGNGTHQQFLYCKIFGRKYIIKGTDFGALYKVAQ